MVARKLVVRQEGCRDETRIKDTPIPASQGPSPKVSTTVSASRGHCLTHDPIRSISYSNCNLNLCTCLGPYLLAHTHDTIIQETVAGGSEVSGQPGIHSKTFAWKTKVKGWRYSSKGRVIVRHVWRLGFDPEHSITWAFWCTPVSSALVRQRQEDQKLNVIFSYTVSLRPDKTARDAV